MLHHRVTPRKGVDCGLLPGNPFSMLIQFGWISREAS